MTKREKMLIDTDVLIDYLKGYPASVNFLESQSAITPLLIASITVAELYSGVRNEKEEIVLTQFINAFQIIPLTTEIAEKAGLFKRSFGKSHGTGRLADAVIAATAESQEATLASLNQKHFRMIANFLLPYKK